MIASFLRGFAYALLGVAFILGVFTAGIAVQRLETPAAVVSPAPAQAQPTTAPKTSAEADFGVFWEAWNIVKAEFIGKVPDDQAMTYAAINGMVDSLDDEHTHFDEPVRASILQSDLNGSFEGIGATVEQRNGQITIVAPLKGRPAEKAGILPGDIIAKIDGQSTDGMTLTEAITHIRGPKDSKVTLTIIRVGKAAPFDVVVTRSTITVDVVASRMLDGGIAYIQLAEFSSPASKAVDDAIQELLKSNPKGLVFDLRGNPGGYLQSAIEIGSEFVPNGVIVSEVDKGGNRTPHPALPGGRAAKIPLVVLIDKGTASASEIVAGAIHDSKRGILVGDMSYGKGSVQVSDALSDNSHLTITIRHWNTPNGTDVHGVGLTPDIPVTFPESDRKGGRDPQLDRAVQYLTTGQ